MMNPLVAAILPTLINLAEHLVAAEGPVVISYLKDELAKLEAKYNKPTLTPVPDTDKGIGNH